MIRSFDYAAAMFISAGVRAGVLYGSAGVAAIGAAIAIARRRARRWQPDDREVPRRGPVARFAPLVLIVCGALGAAWAWRHSIDVLLVLDGAGHPRVERRLATSIDEPIASGARATLDNPIFEPLWLVNESSTTVRVETIQYGGSSDVALDDPPIVFPPHTAGVFYRIEYVGPDDRPPDHVMGNVVFGDFRYWLTW